MQRRLHSDWHKRAQAAALSSRAGLRVHSENALFILGAKGQRPVFALLFGVISLLYATVGQAGGRRFWP